MRSISIISATAVLTSSYSYAFSVDRRSFFHASAITASTFASPAFCLDMDAFMNAELNSDKPKEMTDDERTCKFAAPGPAKGAACERAGMSTAGKGKGVDAFGNIDRGDFVRCKTSYPMIDGKYVKTVTCQ